MNEDTKDRSYTGMSIDDRYTVMNPLGHGANGSVYLVDDAKLGKKRALKIVRDMSEGELEALKRIDHPAFPGIIDIVKIGERHGIVMELVKGVTLAEFCRTHTVSVGTLCIWMREIAEALEYIHSLNPVILYMDCKPGNIILGEDGHLHLIDLGSAYVKGYTDSKRLSGTLPYASPEQRKCEEVDCRSDIYSLGMTMLSLGGLKRERPSLSEYLRYRLGRHDKLTALRCITERCTAASPDDRYQNVSELIYHLDQPMSIRYRRPAVREVMTGIFDFIYKQTVTIFCILSFNMYGGSGLIPYLILGIMLFALLIGLSVRSERIGHTSSHTWQCNRDIFLSEAAGALLLALLCVMLTHGYSYADTATDTASDIPSVTIYDSDGAKRLYRGQYVVRSGDSLYLCIPASSLDEHNLPAKVEVHAR